MCAFGHKHRSWTRVLDSERNLCSNWTHHNSRGLVLTICSNSVCLCFFSSRWFSVSGKSPLKTIQIAVFFPPILSQSNVFAVARFVVLCFCFHHQTILFCARVFDDIPDHFACSGHTELCFTLISDTLVPFISVNPNSFTVCFSSLLFFFGLLELVVFVCAVWLLDSKCFFRHFSFVHIFKWWYSSAEANPWCSYFSCVWPFKLLCYCFLWVVIAHCFVFQDQFRQLHLLPDDGVWVSLMFFWSSSSASWCLGFAELVCSSLGVRVCFLASFERAYWTWTACENHSFLLRYFGQTFFHSLFFSADFSFNNLSKFANVQHRNQNNNKLHRDN